MNSGTTTGAAAESIPAHVFLCPPMVLSRDALRIFIPAGRTEIFNRSMSDSQGQIHQSCSSLLSFFPARPGFMICFSCKS